MPRVKLICKNCGKEYEACRTPSWGVWRWQDVACSMDCGQEYLTKIEESRKKTATKITK